MIKNIIIIFLLLTSIYLVVLNNIKSAESEKRLTEMMKNSEMTEAAAEEQAANAVIAEAKVRRIEMELEACKNQ
ncbi:MAG: hypothetical protein OCD76_20710 [Reichenbachiella sp.]